MHELVDCLGLRGLFGDWAMFCVHSLARTLLVGLADVVGQLVWFGLGCCWWLGGQLGDREVLVGRLGVRAGGGSSVALWVGFQLVGCLLWVWYA